MLKKILKYTLRAVLILLGLFALLLVLVYLPPVQNFIKGRAADYVSRNMGIKLEVDRFRVRFPLSLSIDNALVRTAQGDTLFGVGELRAGVALLPLLRGSIEVRSFRLKEAAINLSDTLGFTLRGTVKVVELGNLRVRLGESSINAGTISLSDVVCDLRLADSADTTASETRPWKIAADKLLLDRVKYTMDTAEQALQMAVDLEKGELKKIDLDLGRQSIDVGTVELNRAVSTFLFDNGAAAQPATEPEPSSPWTIRVGRVELADQTATYATRLGQPRAGFDPAHIHASGLNARIDSFSFIAGDLAATIKNLELHERSGLEITNLKGQFAMDPERIDLAGFVLETPSSHVEADVHAGRALLEMSPEAPLTVKLKASVSSEDLFMAYPADAQLRRAIPQRLIADADLAGQLDDVTINSLRVEMPSRITFHADGHLISLTDAQNISGNLRVNGQFTNIDFVKEFLPASARERVGFPRRMTLAGTVGIDRGTFSPNVRLAADGGRMDIKGAFSLRARSYDVHVAADKFPLGTFLPADSLGLATFNLRAKGRGFDLRSPATAADVDLTIGHFDFKNFNHHDIELKAVLKNGTLDGTLTSNNEALQLDLAISGRITAEQYAAHLTGRIAHADLMAMHLSQTPLGGSIVLDVSAAVSRDKSAYKVDAVLDSIRFVHGVYTEKIARTTLTASADATAVKAALHTGDLALDFSSPASLTALVDGIGALTDNIAAQLAARSIDMSEIENILPQFSLTLTAGKNNVAHNLMEERGFAFNALALSAGRGDTTALHARGLITGLHTAGLTLDTLNVGLRVRNEQLGYFVRLANRPGSVADLGLIYLFGNLKGNTAHMNVRQRNRAGELGFNFGVDAELRDSSIRASFFPATPTLGYAEWRVNDGNFVEYHFNKEFYADLRFETSTSHIHILSASDPRMPRGSVRLDISRLNIQNTLALLPVAPPFEGFLNTDILLGIGGRMVAAIGQVGVDSLVYDRNLIGDVNAEIISHSDNAGVWNLDGKFTVDQKAAFNVQGTFDPQGGTGLDATLDIPALPLAAVNLFLPEDMAQLSGTMTGDATMHGPLNDLEINGMLGFADGKVTVPILGTTFGISAETIRITNNRVTLRDFGLTSPNGQMLAIEGTLDLRGLTAALDISGNNFQVVNSPRSGGSQIYGLAAVDVDVTARGPVGALVIRGDVQLLRATDVTYTMRGSPLSTQVKQQDIVTFISFADSAALAEQEAPVAAARTSGMNILVNVDIDQGVKTTVNLSENAENRIELTGGGALAFTMSSQGDVRLTGRYTIANGTVVYNPPVISQKIFTINENSDVEWNGEPANPRFNITAVNVVSANVITSTNLRSRVDFNIIIKVENTLQDMAISFDLTAPNNGEIQTELTAMTPEQRSQQALALLAYGTYTGPGTTTERNSLNANDLVNQQLNSFITREINQWARNSLPGIDLQVGAQTVSDATGSGQHTNFSYSVSKTLFSDRVTVRVGGSLNDMSPNDISDNFIDDISIEYRLSRRDNMFLKLFRHNTMENIFEGQITQTGIGFVLRKQMQKLSDLFRRDHAQRTAREQRRHYRRELREEERRAAERDTLDIDRSDSAYMARRAARDSMRADSLQRNETQLHRDSLRRHEIKRLTPHERRRPEGKKPRRDRNRQAAPRDGEGTD